MALAAYGCASSGKADVTIMTSSSDEVIWEAGQKAVSKRDYDVARQYFKRLIDGFPQSVHGPEARVAVADSFFYQQGAANYVLAISGYRDFVTLYPQHPKSDYAQFQIAESYYRQRNTPDRDQTPTMHAVDEFDRLLDLYPSSPYAETARQRIIACRQDLARGSFIVGYFYQRTRKACRAAISRYETVLKDFADYNGLDEVLFRLGQCLVTSGRAPEALPHLQKVLEDYPQSPFAGEVRQLLAVVAATKTAPTPPNPLPSPSPAPATVGAVRAPAPSPSPSSAATP
jgi:outer membrane protein assembly factor BamD